ENGLHYSFDMRSNFTFDSVSLFMSSADISNQQIFRWVTIDSSLTGLENTNIFNSSLQYEPGLTVSANIFNHGVMSDYQAVFVGPHLRKNSDEAIGMLRYDRNSQTFDRELIIPDSGFSFS